MKNIFSQRMKNDFSAKKGRKIYYTSYMTYLPLVWLSAFVIVVVVFISFRVYASSVVTCSIGHFWMYTDVVWETMLASDIKKRHLWSALYAFLSLKYWHTKKSLIQTRNSCMQRHRNVCIVVSCKVISKRNINNNNSDTDNKNTYNTASQRPTELAIIIHTHTCTHKSHKTIPSEPPESFTSNKYTSTHTHTHTIFFGVCVRVDVRNQQI